MVNNGSVSASLDRAEHALERIERALERNRETVASDRQLRERVKEAVAELDSLIREATG